MLSAPLEAGRLRLRNRLVFPAHLTNQAEDGLPTAQHVAYYAARAAGGAGLVITEEQGVDPHDRPYEKTVDGTDPRVVPWYRRLTGAVHAHGAVVLAQLTHNGGQSSGLYTRRPVLAPSPVPDPLFREVPVALDAAGIARVVEGYARTAAHCVAGGFDGVEIQGAHSSLVRQFLSPATNHRTDAYGRDPARFLLEVVDAVRAVLGPDRVLGVRLCGDEGVEYGIGIADAVAVARRLAATGRVDLLGTTVGVATATLHLVSPSLRVPAGYASAVPAALRAAVDLPVIGVGRFTTREQAERALADGSCDLVGAVRGQIADPAFASTRVCVGCNQECVGRVGRNLPLGCAVNPRAGREAQPLPVPGVRRRVLVVGAGPAGLRAAATAAQRGHRVLLCERDGVTGGAVRLAAAAPGRAEFGHVVRDLLHECRAAGVDVRTGVEVDADLVAREAPDAVVLATGARPAPPPWAHGRVVDMREVLSGAVRPEGTVLVYDELGFHQAPAAAELLAARGCRVEITTPAMVVAQDLGTTLDLELFHRRARAAGIALTTDRVVTGAADGRVELLHHPTGRAEHRAVDWVVAVVPPAPEDALWTALRDGPHASAALPVHRIGDCLAPRRVPSAVVEGHRVGVEL